MCAAEEEEEKMREKCSPTRRGKRGGEVKKSQLPMRTEKNTRKSDSSVCRICLLKNDEVKDSVDDLLCCTKVLAESVPADTTSLLIPSQDAEMGVTESISQTGSVFS